MEEHVNEHQDRGLFLAFVWYWCLLDVIIAVYGIGATGFFCYSIIASGELPFFGTVLTLILPLGIFASASIALWKMISAYRREEYAKLHRYFALPALVFVLILVFFYTVFPLMLSRN